MNFEWDPKKEALNSLKHGVSFIEAMSVFDDTTALIFDDVKHSVNEKREYIIGTSVLERLLIVSFTQREVAVRIISSRKPNGKERKKYEEHKESKG